MLKREIGRWDLVFLMINGIIGAGIFGLPSKIFALSGVYSILAMFVCAVIVFVIVLVFAEVASKFKETGGPYLYTLAAFGPFPAFIIGWLMLLTRLAAFAALINLFVSYLSYFNPVFIEPPVKALTIFLFTLFLTIINYRGVKDSAILSNTLAIAKVSTLFIFIIVGLFFINPELIDFGRSSPGLTDFSSSVLILIFAFTGFEAILVNTGEVRNPKKNIPFALLTTIIAVAVIYMFIQTVSIGTLPDLATSDKPLTDAAQIYMGPVGGFVITAGALISIGGTLNAIMLIGSRLQFAFSETGEFPKIFSYLHPKFQTPVFSLFAFSVIAVLVSVTGSFIYAVSISVISKVLTLLVVCIVLIKLRISDPKDSDYFKLPYGYSLAVTGIITSVWLLSSTKLTEIRDVSITVLIGVIFYFIYRMIKKRKTNKQ
jgi:basic amino acid/polyamine antiporter, APA family